MYVVNILLKNIPVLGSVNNIKRHDYTTYFHSVKVAELAVYIGKICKLTTPELDNLYIAALLHDIGKIKVPQEILLKPSALTNAEWNVIKSHPANGVGILKNEVSINNINILNSVLSHHEYFNGMGYPRNLVGENIPFKARIISIADALDAMVSLRTYKIAQSLDLALREINMCSGEQFDPYIVKTSSKWNKNILENTLYSPVAENILAL